MSKSPLSHGMVLAAGLGRRLRPISHFVPKPLVRLAGKPLLDHALDHLRRAGVKRLIVNVHHLADIIERHLQSCDAQDVTISDERDGLLETGGGVVKALPLLGRGPFFVLNSDTLLVDGARPALSRMAAAWSAERMDLLLLLCPTSAARGNETSGDFHLDEDLRLHRRQPGETAPYVFTGVQILNPGLLSDSPDGPFSLNLIYDRAMATGRAFGLVHDGAWYHVGNMKALSEVEALLADDPVTGAGT